MLFIAGVVYVYFNYVAKNPEPNLDNISSITSGVVAGQNTVYSTSYFQFQAKDTWVEVTNETTANKFVYRDINNTLLQHELNIYVNQIPDKLKPNYLIPVDIKRDEETTRFIADELQGPCGDKVVKDDQLGASGVKLDFKNANISGVSFDCYVQDNPYSIIVGLKGGGTNITLPRPNGSTAVYTLYYKDLTATPSGNEFMNIVSTFQTR